MDIEVWLGSTDKRLAQSLRNTTMPACGNKTIEAWIDVGHGEFRLFLLFSPFIWVLSLPTSHIGV
jgi:hypothetical protein